MTRAAFLMLAALMLPAATRGPLAGRIAGAPARCIDGMDVTGGPAILADGRILYQRSRRRIWVTRPIDACPALRTDATLIVERYGSQLCANDRFRAFVPPTTIPGGVCRFGPFTPYDLPAAR